MELTLLRGQLSKRVKDWPKKIGREGAYPVDRRRTPKHNAAESAGTSRATSGSLSTRIYSYIYTAAFSTAPQFTFGNLSRTIGLRSPGPVNWDMSLIKTFWLCA